MSVMECGRRNCSAIMCDRIILNRTRYICNSCFGELLEAKRDWPMEMTAQDVYDRIAEFMDTRPGAHKRLEGLDIDAEFHRLTGG